MHQFTDMLTLLMKEGGTDTEDQFEHLSIPCATSIGVCLLACAFGIGLRSQGTHNSCTIKTAHHELHGMFEAFANKSTVSLKLPAHLGYLGSKRRSAKQS